MTRTEIVLLVGAAGLAVAAFFVARSRSDAERAAGRSSPMTVSLASLGTGTLPPLDPTHITGTSSLFAAPGVCGSPGEMPGKGVVCCNGFNPETGGCR